MPIVLARVDDRLIHGQVTEGWGTRFQAEVILVVSNEIASSEWQAGICMAALPPQYEGIVTDVAGAPAMINRLADDIRPSYVLFEKPVDACDAVERGARIERLNVGGMHSAYGKREILDYIFVDDSDIACFRKLAARGVQLDFRDLPDHAGEVVLDRL